MQEKCLYLDKVVMDESDYFRGGRTGAEYFRDTVFLQYGNIFLKDAFPAQYKYVKSCFRSPF